MLLLLLLLMVVYFFVVFVALWFILLHFVGPLLSNSNAQSDWIHFSSREEFSFHRETDGSSHPKWHTLFFVFYLLFFNVFIFRSIPHFLCSSHANSGWWIISEWMKCCQFRIYYFKVLFWFVFGSFLFYFVFFPSGVQSSKFTSSVSDLWKEAHIVFHGFWMVEWVKVCKENIGMGSVLET